MYGTQNAKASEGKWPWARNIHKKRCQVSQMFSTGYKTSNANIIKKKEKMNIVEDAFYIINGIFVVLMIRSVCCVVLIHPIH